MSDIYGPILGNRQPVVDTDPAGYDSTNDVLKVRQTYSRADCNGGYRRQCIYVASNTTGGTFKLNYDNGAGDEMTDAINWSGNPQLTTAGNLGTELVENVNVGANGIIISGSQFPGRQLIEFQDNGTVVAPYKLMTVPGAGDYALTKDGAATAQDVPPVVGYAIKDTSCFLHAITITTPAAATLQLYSSSYPDPNAKLPLITVAVADGPRTIFFDAQLSALCIVPSSANLRFVVHYV